MHSEDLICEYSCCKLILENPVALPCGSTICLEHLKELNDKFTCYICKKEHKIPEDGFFVNKTITKMINNYINSNLLRMVIKESFEILSESIEEYEKFDPDCYVFDYFAEIRNKVDLLREVLKKEIDQKSDEIIQELKEKEEKCKSNAQILKKMNLEELKNQNIPSWKQKFRIPQLNQEELNELSSILIEKEKIIQNKLKNYKNKLMQSESIQFESFEKSIVFGKLKIEYFNPVLSNICGQLIKEYNANEHSGLIKSVQVDEKSNKLITGSEDKTIKIWDLETGKCLKTLNNHAKEVISILMIPNNKFISGSDDRTFKVWDLNSYECLKTIENRTGIYSLCLISDNQIACGDRHGSIHIWNFDKSTLVKTFRAHNFWVYNMLLIDETKLISCSRLSDKKIKIWSLKSYECIRVLEGHTNSIRYLELTLDGNLLSCSKDNTIKLWQIESGEMLKSIQFDCSVNCIKTLNEDLIAAALFNGQIVIYDINKMKIVKSISGHTKLVKTLNLLSNGDLFSVSSNGDIKLFKLF